MNTNLRIKNKIKREDLVYPELSYQIIGILFNVHNSLGHGFAEKIYQKAVATNFRNSGLKFQEQVYAPLVYQEERVGFHYFDFLVENKIVVEIKKGNRFLKSDIEQVYQYLLNMNLKLGILAYFAPNKLHSKRIINLDS